VEEEVGSNHVSGESDHGYLLGESSLSGSSGSILPEREISRGKDCGSFHKKKKSDRSDLVGLGEEKGGGSLLLLSSRRPKVGGGKRKGVQRRSVVT